MGTAIVATGLVAVVALIIRSIVVSKKKGKSIQCKGDCGHCGGHCH